VAVVRAGNCFEDDGAALLAPTLLAMPHLTSLDLGGTRNACIGGAGVIAAVRAEPIGLRCVQKIGLEQPSILRRSS
jgi:hypothetical protein